MRQRSNLNDQDNVVLPTSKISMDFLKDPKQQNAQKTDEFSQDFMNMLG